jgi:homoserine O-acetyltransferase
MAHEYDSPDSPRSVGWVEAHRLRVVEPGTPFVLEAGGQIAPVDVEFETYGTLNAARDNAVLICHALSGDAHVAGWDRHADPDNRSWRARKPGWWDDLVGPGKAVDTRRYFVICSNVLGGCYGTTGPASLNPATGKPYALAFPIVTIGDWVRIQARLLDRLGIDRLHAVIGGSLGGQQAIEWSLAFPERVARAVVLAAAPRLSAQGLAYNAVGRFTIMNDRHFHGGNYYDGQPPSAGLAAARMLAHITYLSEESIDEKFGRRLQGKDRPDFGHGVEFAIESYLDHQGRAFVERFDANSYLAIIRAMDYYDAANWGAGDLTAACRRIQARVQVVSFSSDWLYTPAQCHEFAQALCRVGKQVTYVDVPSRYGHDAFLVEADTVNRLVGSFLNTSVSPIGSGGRS